MRRVTPHPLRAAALAFALASTHPGAAAQESGQALAPVSPWQPEAVQDRLRQVRVEGLPLGAYHLAKAQAWLDAAIDAHHLGDRGAGTREPLAEAERLLRRLAAAEPGIPTDTSVLPGSSRLREDLWQRADRLKAHPGFRCAQAGTARFEVMLAMAAHFAAYSGWREARAYVQGAERLGRDAQRQIEDCPAPQAAGTEPADR